MVRIVFDGIALPLLEKVDEKMINKAKITPEAKF